MKKPGLDLVYKNFRPVSNLPFISKVVEKAALQQRNRLMINDAKTDFLIIGTRQQLEKTSIESIIIGDTVIKPLESVRNLGS